MQPKDAAFRKRTQIAKANRTMFLWIAGSSALLGFAIVTAIFLGQKMIFNGNIIAERQATVSILQKNLQSAPDLEAELRALDANEYLGKLKASDSDQAVQVVLDALPADNNPIALGASLQNKLLIAGSPFDLISLQVDNQTDSNAIKFRFAASGDLATFRKVLTNLENSIRTVSITSVHISSAGSSRQDISAEGEAYFEPAKVLELKEETR